MFNPMFDYANLNKWIINFIIKVIIVIDISIRGKKITITINRLNMTIMIVRIKLYPLLPTSHQQFTRLLLNQLPRCFHMLLLRQRPTNRKPQHEFPTNDRMCHKCFPASIHRIKQLLVHLHTLLPLIFINPQFKANKRQSPWHNQVESLIFSDKFLKVLCHVHITPHVFHQISVAKTSNDHPQLHCAKPPAQCDLPIFVVDHIAGFSRGVPQYLWLQSRGLVMHDLMYGAPSEVIWMMTEINELVHCIRQYTESTNYNVNARSLQSKQQSIFASSHLCGFILNESAISSPSKYRLNSGQIAALPAHAASTWNHTPNSLATSPISLNGSTAPTAVVPTVPHKYNGTILATTSASIAALTLSAVNAYPVSADVDITRKFLAGIPTSFAAF
ncbi:hypothetical protein IEQ34_016916 [Dendrobium chrysotoxum]|uniref:Uncharacterized protein n=1 Tax=Dendrobium chrysotoxum TaxID=161865 RepID=A0AAV7GFL7_DENCH|nr:hypothetical protein IEQ34_016916 [Dendrobium chrysotoxum]